MMAPSTVGCAVHLLLYLNLIYFAKAFNFEADPPLTYGGDPGSYFGYSVALHQTSSQHWAIVGAPLSNCTEQNVCNKHKLQGTIYKCGTKQGSSACNVLPIDPDGPNILEVNGKPVTIEHKERQWLGATVYSEGKDKNVVACAPRYVFRGLPLAEGIHDYMPLGMCFVIDSTSWTRVKDLEPCRSEKGGNNYYGYCSAGFSVTSIMNGETIIMGAPGVTNWKGQLAAYDRKMEFYDFTSGDQLTAGSYMGYGLSSGNFLTDTDPGFVGGAPRAADLKGKAIIYQKTVDYYTLEITNVLEGQDQIGTYYGSSVCAVNLNGDRRSDLLIGAPTYSVVGDEGRVFVYINNNGAMDLMRSGPLIGDNVPGARFGSAIADIGDVNRDGFNDVAIGAPYQDNGVVFVYHGYNDGVKTQYSQKLVAQNTKAFGISISGGVDVDSNGYPDMLVGAYQSDSAVLFRARPVIDVTPTIILSKSIIDVNETSVACGNKACLTVKVCFEYRGKDIISKTQEVEYTLELEKDRTKDSLQERVETSDGKPSVTNKLTMTAPNTQICATEVTVVVVDMKEKNYDFWSPVTFDVTFKLTSTDAMGPVLNTYLPKTLRKEASFQRNCGSDNKCEPDLQLSADVVFPDGESELRLGKVEEMTVDISVVNKGEDAYLSKVIMKYPRDLLFAGVDNKLGNSLCSTSELDNITAVIICEIGNPVKQDEKREFGLKLSTTGVTGQKQTLVLDIEATSSNKDPISKQDNNKKKININVKLEADLTIFGVSSPDQLTYKGKFRDRNDTGTEEQIGPEVFLSVTVKNLGPSTVEKSQAEISIPTKLDSNDPQSYLFYMLPELVVEGSGNCQGFQLNPLNVNITNTEETSGRKRRETDEVKTVSSWGCRRVATCLKFTCNIGRLERGQQTIIRVRARLWQSTLIKRDPGRVELITFAKVSAPEISLLSQPQNHKPDTAEIVTRVNPEESGVGQKSTPAWIIIVAVLAGAILLAVAVFVMYKLGFFKRNKPPKDISGPVPEEQEPMNQP